MEIVICLSFSTSDPLNINIGGHMVYSGFMKGVITWLGSFGVIIGLLLATVISIGAILRYVGDEKADEFLFGEEKQGSDQKK